MLNNVSLMGRLTADPELKHTPNSIPVVRFTLAVDRSYVKAGGERVTDFIDVVAWRSHAEFVSKYFRKGQLVAVEGSIQTGSYVDKDGVKRKTFEIVTNAVHFAEPKRDAQGAGFSSEPNGKSEEVFSNVEDEEFKQVPADDDDLPF